MRSKYIRFFVSSTFKDTELERNLLQEVFDELVPIYKKREWQIENVDLRWGISEEAGIDNRTMRICKKELALRLYKETSDFEHMGFSDLKIRAYIELSRMYTKLNKYDNALNMKEKARDCMSERPYYMKEYEDFKQEFMFEP